MKQGQKTRFKDFIVPNVPAYAVSVVLAVLGVGCGMIPYITVHRLLMRLAKGETSIAEVSGYAAVIIAAFAAQPVLHSISTAVSHKTAFSVLEKIRLAITEKMIRMPLGFTRNKGAGYFHSLLIDGIERLEFPLAHALPETTSNVLIPVSITALLFASDWRLALAVLVPAAVTLLLYLPMYVGIMNDFVNTYYAALENMNGRVIEYIRGNKEIKIFGTEAKAYSRFEDSIDRYEVSTLRLYNKMHFVSSPAFVLLSSITVSVLSVGGLLFTSGSIDAPLYLFAVIIAEGLGSSLLKFTEFMDNFYHIKNGKKMIEEVLSAPELEEAAACPEIAHNEIVFDTVCFSYDEMTAADNDCKADKRSVPNVLHNVSLTIKEGKKTAIVGHSGSGKSTIANLIARFWDVSSGSITIGGVDYKNIPLAQLMEHVNYVTQDTFLFNMSILENIRVGNPAASDKEVKEAARLAQCTEFIEKLENGWNSFAGNEGTKLSGGQRQRIIIARAVLRNAPVLILDEAVSHTDAENRRQLQLSLRELCKNKTVITIDHNLSTVKESDSIIVMEKGRVHAQGTHTELLENSEVYKRLWGGKLC
ncbi:ABC transporter ATP-binding protein [Treponema sp. OMZ 840]|uniref:ABC transporter ATP-binding protein n=1 Tax=Treponema sp. OMZ 840 TaxID=244313 RepID=UPI003D8C38D7